MLSMFNLKNTFLNILKLFSSLADFQNVFYEEY